MSQVCCLDAGVRTFSECKESARMTFLKMILFFVKDQTRSPVEAAGGFTLIAVGTGLGF